MNRNRFNFTQPYWEFVLPLLSWLFLLPLLVSPNSQSVLEITSTGLMNNVGNFVSNKTGLYIVASISITFLSWSVGAVITRHELLRKRDFMPAGFAALFGSLAVLLLGFSLSYLAVFFYLQALNSLMQVKRESKSFGQIFNAGFLLTVGALIDARLWLAFPFMVFSLLTLRKLGMRDLFILLAGVLNVLLLGLGIYFVSEGGLPPSEILFSSGEFDLGQYSQRYINIAGACAGLILLIGVLASERYIATFSNRAKYRFRIFTYITFLLGLFSYMWSYYSHQGIEFSFFMAPAAMAATIYATSINNRPLRILFQLGSIALFVILIILFFI